MSDAFVNHKRLSEFLSDHTPHPDELDPECDECAMVLEIRRCWSELTALTAQRDAALAERDAERARAERAEGVVKAAQKCAEHSDDEDDLLTVVDGGAFRALRAALAASAPNPEGARDGT